MSNASETLAKVKLGGAWKRAAEREQELETSIVLLKQELDGLRAVLKVSEGKVDAQQGEILDLRNQCRALGAQNAELRHQATDQQSLIERLKGSMQRTEERETAAHQQVQVMADKLGEAEESLRRALLVDQELRNELEAALRECEEIQAQYDHVEERAENAEKLAEKRQKQVEVLRKSKDQKEKHVCVLVKERDRMHREIVQLKSEASKRNSFLRKNTTSPFSSHPVDAENIDPNPKLETEEHAKLAKFQAPNRLKEKLGKEIALRKQLEIELNRMSKENQALRIRYRNLQHGPHGSTSLGSSLASSSTTTTTNVI